MREMKVERVWTTAAGLQALAVLTGLGHRCGYVGVGEDHPLFGIGYGQECEYLEFPGDEPIGKRGILSLLGGEPTSPGVVFDVHGGITFAGDRTHIEGADKELWFFGFDCAHAGDAPEPEPDYRQDFYQAMGCEVVRTLDYVVGECESLARQIIARTKINELQTR